MSETTALSQLRALVSSSLFAVSGVYQRRANGELQFDGQRPGSGWVAHGYYDVRPGVLRCGEGVRVRLWKRRWLLSGTRQTCHSEPSDMLPGYRFCTLVLSVKLWAWLDAEVGLHSYAEVLPGLDGLGSRRSVQRWCKRLGACALEIQQAIRLAVIERSEPRPLERVFPAGLDPPEKLRRQRYWRAHEHRDLPDCSHDKIAFSDFDQ